MTEARVLECWFPLPPTVNDLERMHHRETTRLRQAAEMRWREVKPRGWAPMERFRVEVVLYCERLCDFFELAYRAKRHIDAACLKGKRGAGGAGVVVDDGPRHLVPTLPSQMLCEGEQKPGMIIRLTELIATVAG
jgi:hypothetical protein